MSQGDVQAWASIESNVWVGGYPMAGVVLMSMPHNN